jgi:sulfide:quinone oxidoreductase
METFFFNQAVPRKSMYWLKQEVMPTMYWTQLLTGLWQGPHRLRTLTNPFKS